MTLSSKILVSLVMCVVSISTVARAELLEFTATLDGAQAANCAGTGSAGTGTGTLTLDTVTGIVSYNITFSGLGAPETVSHVHGPGAECVGAGIVYGLPLGSPKVGSSPALTAQEQADMIAGLHYVNIHSDDFTGGEIRGQVLPVSIPTVSEWGLLVMTLLLVTVGTVVFVRHKGKVPEVAG